MADTSIWQCTVGYTSLCISALTYVTIVCLLQMLGDHTNLFMLCCCRFTVEVLFAAVIVAIFQLSIFIPKKDVYKFLVSTLLNYIFISAFYLSSYNLPAGNLDGIYGGLYILLATFVDTLQNVISKFSVVTSGFAVCGLLLLTQPWSVGLTHQQALFYPCEDTAGINISTVHVINPSDNTSGYNLTTPVTSGYFNSPIITGYLGLLVASTASVATSNIYKHILQTYSLYCLQFWSGVLQLLYSILVTVVLKLSGAPHMSLPSPGPCLWFTLAFVSSGVMARMSTNLATKYLPVSKVALSTPVTTAILYLLQRTVLKALHPGHGNLLEVIGILCILSASLLSPLLTILVEANLSFNTFTEADKTSY